MTTIGELLVRLQDRTELEEILAQSGDILALSRLDKLEAEKGSNACDAALEAVEAFTTRADDEAWRICRPSVDLRGSVRNPVARRQCVRRRSGRHAGGRNRGAGPLQPWR